MQSRLQPTGAPGNIYSLNLVKILLDPPPPPPLNFFIFLFCPK